jgi:TonB family protein
MRFIASVLTATFTLLLFLSSPAQCKKKGKCSYTDKDGYVHKGKMLDSLKTGVWKTYNAKKQLIEEATYVRGKENGPCKYYFPEDTSYTAGNYLNGRVNGQWATYNSKGILVHSRVWARDTMHGPCYEFYKGHKTVGEYTKGKKTGWWIESDLDNGFVDSAFYVNNKKEGHTSTRVGNVLRSSGYWSEGKKHGSFLEFDSLGRPAIESYYKNNIPDSIYRMWKNGKLKSEYSFCSGGRYCGIFNSWKDNGTIDMITKYDSLGNRLWFSAYNDQGKITRTTWFNKLGQMDSISIYLEDQTVWYTMIDTGTTQSTKGKSLYQRFYYRGGRTQLSGYMVDSRRVGNWYGYDTLGNLQYKMTYELSQLMGPFIVYYPNGKTKLTAICFQGYTDSIVVFDPKGKMVKQTDPLFNATINECKKWPTEVRWRNPNEFPAENGKRTRVTIGDVATLSVDGIVPPRFPGGDDSLRAFISRNVKFPEAERRLGISGEVKVRFSVNTDGTLSEMQIVQEVSNGPGLTKATLQAVRRMPKWNPQTNQGQAEKAGYVLSVKFVLE